MSNKQTNKQTNKRTNEQTNKQTNKQTNTRSLITFFLRTTKVPKYDNIHTLHCITLALHCVAFHCVASHCIASHGMALHCSTSKYIIKSQHIIYTNMVKKIRTYSKWHHMTSRHLALHHIASHCTTIHTRTHMSCMYLYVPVWSCVYYQYTRI